VASTKRLRPSSPRCLLASSWARFAEAFRGESEGSAQEFTRIPHKIETILQGDEKGVFESLARQFSGHRFSLLGRGIHYPIALEGALKLKEISIFTPRDTRRRNKHGQTPD